MKPKEDEREIRIIVPDTLYCQIRQVAENEIRSVSNQARFFIEIGMQYLESMDKEPPPPERESAIGFVVDKEPEYEDEDEECKRKKEYKRKKRK